MDKTQLEKKILEICCNIPIVLESASDEYLYERIGYMFKEIAQWAIENTLPNLKPETDDRSYNEAIYEIQHNARTVGIFES